MAAWTWKLTAVSGTVAAKDDVGNPITIDLTKQGQFTATVDVFDDKGAKLDTRNYQFPFDVDTAAAQAKINTDIARIRDAKARVTSLTALIGQTITVP